MTMRLADISEAAELAKIHAQCFSEIWSAEAVAALLASPGSFAMVAEGGFIMVRAAADESELLTLAVTPAARRRGIATALVLGAAKHAAEVGAGVMFLEVNAANLPAISLYKRLGFAAVGNRKAYYAGAHGMREDALVLCAEIPLFRVGI
jgi:ribosomal-protein-alanine N-acetyltransferase